MGAGNRRNTKEGIRHGDEAGLFHSTEPFPGKSLYPDPYQDGSLDELRIYCVGLSSAEIAATFAMGPRHLLSTNSPQMGAVLSGTNLTFSWPSANAGFMLQSRTNLALASSCRFASCNQEISAPS